MFQTRFNINSDDSKNVPKPYHSFPLFIRLGFSGSVDFNELIKQPKKVQSEEH